MARILSLIVLVIIAGFYISITTASVCSSDSECLHFQYCCKGNCTSKRFKCDHICVDDNDCGSARRCVLGLCVNCTRLFSCDFKTCMNDTHCPGTHTCKDQVCVVKKNDDLTTEMLPFIIFITALSVSLLIVCYNDYVLERLGHRGCVECVENRICNCSLFLKIWMWRHQRQQQQQRNELTPSCPVEVRFDSRIVNPSNSSNEKRETGLFWSIETLKGRLMFWRRFSGFLQSNGRSNDREESENTNSVSNNRLVSSVVLLNDESMNTNEVVTGNSTDERTLSNSINASRISDHIISNKDRNSNSNSGKEIVASNRGVVSVMSSRLNVSSVNSSTVVTTSASSLLNTGSRIVTLV